MRAAGLVLVACASVGLAAPAAAEEQLTLKAEGAAPLPLVIQTTLQPDCSPRTLAAARVVVAPSHGRVAIRHGRMRKQGSACPAAPGFIVMYLADRDYIGADHVEIELVEGGVASTRQFEITVEAGDPARAPVINSETLT